MRPGEIQGRRGSDHDCDLSLHGLPANEFQRVFIDGDDSERWI